MVTKVNFGIAAIVKTSRPVQSNPIFVVDISVRLEHSSIDKRFNFLHFSTIFFNPSSLIRLQFIMDNSAVMMVTDNLEENLNEIFMDQDPKPSISIAQSGIVNQHFEM